MSGRRIGSPRSSLRPRVRMGAKPSFEGLEQRELLSTFTVTNTGDLTPSGAIAPGSLRDAINRANASSGLDTIKFNIPGTGVHSIALGGAMLSITDPVSIDGTSQPGYGGSPVILLDGTSAGGSANGLTLATSGVTIKALTIVDFAGDGILIQSGGAQIGGCFIGNDGSRARPNKGDGIHIKDSNLNVIGGTAVGTRNIISGNGSHGIGITGDTSTGNQIVGNYIGTDSSGTRAIPNAGNGVDFVAGSFNIVGGMLDGAGNVISGNAFEGISLFSAATTKNTIEGNFIGTDASGTFAIGNGFDGISITGAPANQIGVPNPDSQGTSLGGRNIISGNGFFGITMTGGNKTVIQNNYIGTDITGTVNLGNKAAGILDNGGSNLLVGGTLAGAGNIVAFNGATLSQGGVDLQSGSSLTVLSNSIFSNSGRGIVHPANKLVPNLTLASTAVARTKVQGTFNNTPNTPFVVQFFTSPEADPSGFGEGKTLLGSELVTTDDTGLGTIDLTLDAPAQVGQFVTATLTDPTGDTSEFSNAQVVTKASISDLSVSVTADPSPATLGGNITYTVKVTNLGPDVAAGVSLVDVLPASATFISDATDHGTLTQASGQVTGDLGDLQQGETATITITVSPTQTGNVSNTVSVDSSSIDPDTGDNKSTISTNVNIPADLLVTMDTLTDQGASAQSFTIGKDYIYLIKVTDTGPGPASKVAVSAVLPSNVTIQQVTTGQGTYQVIGQTVTATLGSLATGTTNAIRIRVTAVSTGTVVGSATATGAEIDPDTTNNTASVSAEIVPAADLRVTLDAQPGTLLSGDTLTYTAVVTNSGPSDATNVALTDLLPSSVTFVSSTGNVTPDVDGKLVFQLGTIAANGSRTIQIVVTPNTSGSLTNSVAVAGTELDPSQTNNSASATVLVDPADLGVTISSSPQPAVAGALLTYTVTVTNAGPAAATSVFLTNTLPTGLSVIGTPVLSQGNLISTAGGKLVASLDTIAAGGTATLTFVVQPSKTGVINDQASVTSDQVDPDTDNNSASEDTAVSPADLAVAMSASSSQSIVGDAITFTAIVSNNGPTRATNVSLTDTLPAGATFVSASTSLGTIGSFGGSVIATLGALNPGDNAVITIVLRPNGEGGLTNTATVSASEYDPNSFNNVASARTSVVNLPGIVQFAQPVFTAGENGGAATITVVRTGGTKGTLAVNYAAIDGTALDGVNFHSTSGTLMFLDGQRTATFVVPLLDDGQQNENHTVSLLLGGVGSTVLGPQSTATLNVVNTDIDVTGPTVQDVQLLGNGNSVTGIVLTFSKVLDPARVANTANYFISAPVTRRRFGRTTGGPVAVASVAYTPGAKTVLITPSQPLGGGVFYELQVNGSTAGGVSDLFGNLLNFNGLTGQAPGNFVTTFARGGNLNYTDSSNNAVNLRLTGGGVIDLFRAANGEGQIMRLLGTVPGRSTLSGNVRKVNLRSTGVTTLSSIQGLGAFGAVRSRLRTPPFVVTQQSLPSVQTVSPTGAALGGRAFVHMKRAAFAHRPVRHFRGR